MKQEIKICGRKYTVTDDGEIFRENGKRLSKYLRKGYEYIGIKDGGKRRKISVHRLVAAVFVPNPEGLSEVNHIDGDPTNNVAKNLEWVSTSENQYHSRYILGNQTGFMDTPVICVETGKEYISTRAAWRDTGVNYCHISECARGKRKTAGGYHWENVR